MTSGRTSRFSLEAEWPNIVFPLLKERENINTRIKKVKFRGANDFWKREKKKG